MNLAPELGILGGPYKARFDRSFSSRQFVKEENKRLLEVWKETKNGNILFLAIQVRTSHTNNKINQIGISRWWPDGWAQLDSFHGQIEQETMVDRSSHQSVDGFIFGETETIYDPDVGPWLDHTFKALQSPHQTTCLIGHNIRHILHLIQPYWQIPSNMIVLDTRAIWEFQNEATQHPSFKQTLEGVDGYRGDESILNNAGNGARLTLKLLQAQISRAELSMHSHGKLP